jgi:hypothetical protein
MVLLILLAALIAWATVSTVLEIRRDGHHAVPTDWSRVANCDPVRRAESGHTYR